MNTPINLTIDPPIPIQDTSKINKLPNLLYLLTTQLNNTLSHILSFENNYLLLIYVDSHPPLDTSITQLGQHTLQILLTLRQQNSVVCIQQTTNGVISKIPSVHQSPIH